MLQGIDSPILKHYTQVLEFMEFTPDDADRMLREEPEKAAQIISDFKKLAGEPQLDCAPLSSFERNPVHWIWNMRIPQSKITVVAGDGGEGKSFLTMGIAAYLSREKALPGGNPFWCHSLMWNGEDAPDDTLRERAEDAGADLDAIHIISGTTNGRKRRSFDLGDVPLLEDMLRLDPRIRFVALDPVMALLGGVDTHRDGETRSALQPLAELAARRHVAILLVMHLNKSELDTILHRLSGSVAFGALARSVGFVGTHSLSGRKSVDFIKHNLSKGRPEPVEFSLDGGFHFVGIAPELTAEAIMGSRRRANRGAMGEGAEAFLREMLRSGPQNSVNIYKQANDRGIAAKTLQRAKEKMGVRARKRGIGVGSIWTWELPDEDSQSKIATDDLRDEENSNVVIFPSRPGGVLQSGPMTNIEDSLQTSFPRAGEEVATFDDGGPDLLELYADKSIDET